MKPKYKEGMKKETRAISQLMSEEKIIPTTETANNENGENSVSKPVLAAVTFNRTILISKVFIGGYVLIFGWVKGTSNPFHLNF